MTIRPANARQQAPRQKADSNRDIAGTAQDPLVREVGALQANVPAHPAIIRRGRAERSRCGGRRPVRLTPATLTGPRPVPDASAVMSLRPARGGCPSPGAEPATWPGGL